ncbi:MAG: hypothetical protein AB1648_04845 [Pseudomonadota bacterium]|jgi:hypothetical protein
MPSRISPRAFAAVLAANLIALAGCGGTATLIPHADNSVEIIGTGYNEGSALDAALAKGQEYCRKLGKNFAAIDQRSSYEGMDPNLKTAINVAAMVSKEPIYGMGSRSDDWRVQMSGKCQ